MAAFLGKFKMYNTQNFDEYMKALGVGMVMRKMAATATPVQDITLDGDTYTIKTTTTFKTTEIKFKLGEPFDEETADGRKVKTTIVQEGDKLVQTQVGDKQTTTLTRDFSVPSEMKMTLVVDNVTCIRNYKKE